MLSAMYKAIQTSVLAVLTFCWWGCAQADYLEGQGASGAPRTGSTSTDSQGSDDTDLGDEDTVVDDDVIVADPSDPEKTDTGGTVDKKDSGDTGAPIDTGAPVDTSDPPTNTDTEMEPDTDFKCVNDLQCTLKWFGTICCKNRCINPLIHPKHCGSCQNDCTADKRGNNCAMGSCVCGPIPGVVCLGEDEGQCCRQVPFINIFACEPC